MHDHRFSAVTSNVIIGVLVVVTSMIIWFTVHAFEEIASIEATIVSTSETI